MVADAAELMRAHESGERRMIADRNMSCQRRVVGEYIARSDYAIVRDVGLGHKQILVADRSQRAAAHRAAVHRYILAYDVAPSDYEARIFAFVLQVLRRLADRGERIDL